MPFTTMTKASKALLFGFFLLISSQSLKAQALSKLPCDTVANRSGQYIGFNAGGSTGIGLTYINWPGKHGYQITFTPIVGEGQDYLSLGLTMLQKIKQVSSYATVFFYWGNLLTNIGTDENTLTYTTGFGPGLQLNTGGITSHLMAGYAFFETTNNIRIGPTFEVSIFYHF